MRRLALAIAMLCGLGFLAWHWAPTIEESAAIIDWIKGAGFAGDVVFVLAYAVATVLLVPASWTHGTAGFLYGPLWGVVVASVLATSLSTINFWLGRTLLRSWVEEKIAQNKRYQAIDRLIEDRGLGVVLLLRVSPLSPFNPLSYVLGATKVRFPDFLLGTGIGGFLPVALFASVGASVSDIAAILSGEAGPGWLRAFALLVTLIVTIIATLYARSALSQSLDDSA